MAETCASIDDLFASDEFNIHFAEWQHATTDASERSDQLFNHLTQRRRADDDPRDGHEIADHVDHLLALSDEDFRDIVSDETAHRLHALREDARGKEQAAIRLVIEYGQSFGISQFALYGLQLHMRKDLEQSAIKPGVIAAERAFVRIDKLVRDNPGELLTVVDLGVYAGRLGTGGITVENGAVTIPTSPDSQSWATSFIGEDDRVFRCDQVNLRATSVYSLHGRYPSILPEGWSGFRDLPRYHRTGKALLAIGEVVEGDLRLSSGHRDFDFYSLAFDRIKSVGLAAMNQSFDR